MLLAESLRSIPFPTIIRDFLIPKYYKGKVLKVLYIVCVTWGV